MTESECCSAGPFKKHRLVVLLVGMALLTTVIVVSILREKFVTPIQNQITVGGRGKVSYKADTAVATLGIQVDKAPSVDSALKQLNDKIAKIIAAEKALGIPEDRITTQNYSLSPQYDFRDGVQSVSGYTSNQQLSIKVENVLENADLLEKAIAGATANGANQVSGIRFEASNVEELKQQARILAIQDAKSKSQILAKAAGIRLGKLVGWYENIVYSPDSNDYAQAFGMGAGGEGGGMGIAKAAAPQIPSGTQEVIIDINLNYEVK